ncbi:PH domain-containing protein [Burkholderia alba]|uniref:PH domain-containing protein n=1 Tax=Burkholderia alba TaxID=2683677 RepID=UPI002B0599B4|nr:PH domain-containing protein [Burkholderia alba]
MRNLPLLLGCGLVIFVCVTVITTLTPPGHPLIVSVLVLSSFAPGFIAMLAVMQTAATHIVLDQARLTCRSGLVERQVASVELYRVQNVVSRSRWWERVFGFGTLIIESSDATRPVWVLRGTPDVEALRDDLTAYALALRDARGVREINMGRV